MCWRLLICCAALSWWLAGCRTAPQPTERLVQRSQPLLGTFVTISVYDLNEAKAQAAISAAFTEFRRVDSLLSIHRTDSEAARVNAVASTGGVQVSSEFYEVLASSLKISERTGGAFDPTIGPLTQLWGFIWKQYRLPAKEELERVLPLIDSQKVDVKEREGAPSEVRFEHAGMFLDFGGIGKGYAVDRAVTVLQGQGIQNAMVKAGGDLRVIGIPPQKEGWEVQLEDPQKEGRRATILLQRGALSTSGNYENFFEVDGVRYSHILNPRTGLPVQGIASCTVTAPTCTESDAYATALFVLGMERSLREFADEFGIRFVDSSGRMVQNPSFPSPDLK